MQKTEEATPRAGGGSLALRIFRSCAFFLAYLIFAGIGSVVSLLCIVPAMLFRGERAARFGQRLIHGLFAFFVGYLRFCGLLELDAREIVALRDSNGLVIVANHPSLLDAVILVSQLPRVVCLMKSSLSRNIVLCGTARLAGYVQNDAGAGMIRQACARLRQRSNVLIFPEGTRTVGDSLHPFKMGFALIARQTSSPVQTVIIETDSRVLGKGWPLLRMPAFPVRFKLKIGPRFVPGPQTDAREFGKQVEAFYRESLSHASQ